MKTSDNSAFASILVINGSPKGENSITLQYVRYLERRFPNHRFEVVNISRNIATLARDPGALDDILTKVSTCDGVLWAFGLWVMSVPAQLMKFIELVNEGQRTACFAGKPAGIITTSIHYYDHTAHQYMRAVCEDLDMRFGASISLDITDLRRASGRNALNIFGETFLNTISSDYMSPRQSIPLPAHKFRYTPISPTKRVDAKGRRILLLTDSLDPSDNETKMAERSRSVFDGGHVETVCLSDIPMKGGCLGCMRCGYDYTCRYRDGFSTFYNETVKAADILVLCGTIRGRHLSSRWKTFFDRAFFWNHTPSLEGKQIAYLISGPLRQNPFLSEILEASATARQIANFVGIITDEERDSKRLDALIDSLAERLIRFADTEYVEPPNFLAVGGLKIFRDEIWGRLRAVWQADFRFYRRNGLFDFPHHQRFSRIFGTVAMWLCKIPWFRKKFYGMLGMPPRRLTQIVDKQ